jgi:hypothetical protein
MKLTLLPRMVTSGVLVLALLSGIAPFKSAAAGNLCTMACCAGLPPHAAGSCHMDLPSSGKLAPEAAPETEDKLCGLSNTNVGAVKGIAAGVMGMTTNDEPSLNLDDVTVDASDHCQVNSQTDAADLSTSGDLDDAASIAARSLAKPCPPGCGSGPTVSRVRRSHYPATVARNGQLRSTFRKKYCYQSQYFLILCAYREQIHPRGPPLFFS